MGIIKNKQTRNIIGGMLIIIISAFFIFQVLNAYLSRQTEIEVRNIAGTYLNSVAAQELNTYSSISDIRYSQIRFLTNRLDALGENMTAENVRKTIQDTASYQDLRTCVMVGQDGEFQTVYGSRLEEVGNKEYLMEKLLTGENVVMTGRNAVERLIVWASPAQYPMTNGEDSMGILYCRKIDQFINQMALDSGDTLATFMIIRRDGSYVLDNSETINDSYFDKVLSHDRPVGTTAEEAVEKLKEAIDSDKSWSMEIEYSDEGTGLRERRSIRADVIPNSNWYLISVLPYGVLDNTITEMSDARARGTNLAVFALGLIVFALFLLYIRMTRKQMMELDIAKTEAEEATKEALNARDYAEAVTAEAEASQEEAIKAKEEAEHANKAKSEFLSNMSHDIRTPMNAIVGMTAIARDHIDDKERVSDCLKKITLSGKQLLGLINDVLDMSKIESGKLNMVPEVVSLRQTMETMCDIIRPQVKENGLNFDIFISNIISEKVWCDGVRLNQVLLNFLSNAVKFTPEGGTIHIDMSQEESPLSEEYVRTHISVKDNGIGMSEKFQEKLFTSFEREDSLRVHKTQGTGLGLTITKFILDAMGGTIDFESKEGEGTTFYVTLDLKRMDDVQDEDMKLPDWKILIVDDNEDLCRTTELSLNELGAKAEWCTDGETAVRLVTEAHRKGEDFFALLIDYKMIGMNGIETAKAIRHEIGNAVPISLISAYDWSEIKDEAEEAGINGFIAKPLFKSTLYQELKKFVGDKGKGEGDLSRKREVVSLKGLRILLPEDNDINAEIAMMILGENGAIVDHAGDGKIALDMFEKSPVGYYKVILMDLRMPHMNGLEATRAIRALDRSDAKTVPIIAMTADAFAEDAQKCLEAGMNGHLAKPIDIDALLRTLSQFME
ncbi:MAG: response regulator [Lachnospiraceae bacterium]|nr:response regulator [Lachnospiraceae bacterium]